MSQPAPSAARIAEILRSNDPWLQNGAGSVGAVDLAQRLAKQQRQMIDQGGSARCYSNVTPKVLESNCIVSGVSLEAVAGSADFKVSQLAERMSLLLASVQRQSNNDRQDLEHHLTSFSTRAEARLASLEARVAVVEEHTKGAGRERTLREEEAFMREVRALVSGAVSEVQAQWRSQRSELMDELQDQSRKLNDVMDSTKREVARIQDAEVAVDGLQQNLDIQAGTLARFEDELHSVVSVNGGRHPPWYGELEGSIARLEHRISDQRASAEHQISRFRTDAEGLRVRLEGLREDALCAVDRRIDQEIDRLMTQRGSSQPSCDKDLKRRLDESEARVAALRVRIDAHDDRFGALGERAEAACQQALEGARQAALQHKDEILQEVDCELSITRQKVEALEETCEEISMRRVSQQRQGWQVVDQPY